MAAMAVLLLAGGCGGDDSSAGADGGEVTVKTGSLSKAEFAKRADQLCEQAEGKFRSKYIAFVKANTKGSKNPNESKNIEKEIITTILVPNFQELVDQISSLGAPNDDKEEVTEFLTSLQRRLDELNEEPTGGLKNFTPFTKQVKLARAYGLTGCAESLD